MKNKYLYVLGVVVMLLSLSLKIFAQTTTENQIFNIDDSQKKFFPTVWVEDFVVDKDIYNSGDIINGSFKIINKENYNISNISYTVSLGNNFSELSLSPEKVFGIEKKNQFLLKANETKELKFSYKIPQNFSSEKAGIEMKTFTSSGIKLGRYVDLFKVKGDTYYLNVENSYITDGEENKFSLQQAPNTKDNRQLYLKTNLINKNNVDFDIEVIVELYDRTITSNLISTIKIDSFKINASSSKEIEINLNNLYTKPGVYEGKLFIENNGEVISNEILFRYTVYGNFVKIHNVISDNKKFNKGDDIVLNLYHTGAPYSIEENKILRQDSLKTKITLTDKKDKVIAEYTGNIDYTKNSSNLKLKSLTSTDYIKIKAEVFDNDKLISIYDAVLIDSQDNANRYNLFTIFTIIFIFIFIFTIILFLKRKMKIAVISLLFFVLFANVSMANNTIGSYFKVATNSGFSAPPQVPITYQFFNLDTNSTVDSNIFNPGTRFRMIFNVQNPADSGDGVVNTLDVWNLHNAIGGTNSVGTPTGLQIATGSGDLSVTSGYPYGTAYTSEGTEYYVPGYYVQPTSSGLKSTALCFWTLDDLGLGGGYAYINTITNPTLSYNANGGSGTVPSSETVTSGTTVTVKAGSLTRTGYVFSGWNTNSSGTGTNYSVGQVFALTSNITLYAKWVANPTLSYNANGGSGTVPSSETVTSGTTVTVKAGSLTRTGYVFSGWNTNSSGTGTNYSVGQTFALISSITLYATWGTSPTYQLIYNGNGATSGSVPSTVSTTTVNANIAVQGNTNGLVKTGMVFSGWNTNSSGTGTDYRVGSNIILSTTTNLYAAWSSIKLTANPLATSTGNSSLLTWVSTSTKNPCYLWGTDFSTTTVSTSSSVGTSTGPLGLGVYNYMMKCDTMDPNIKVYSDSSGLGTSATGTVITIGTLNLSANPLSVNTGFSSNLSWNSTNATTSNRCLLWQSDNGSAFSVFKTLLSANNSTTTGTLSASKYYRIQCPSINSGNLISNIVNISVGDYRTLSYDANGATSGNVPSATTTIAGNVVPVLGQGNLVREGAVFESWNTQLDGLGADYYPGGSITLTNDTVLYAKWDVLDPVVDFYADDTTILSGTKPKLNFLLENVYDGCDLYANGTNIGHISCPGGSCSGSIPESDIDPVTENTRYVLSCSNDTLLVEDVVDIIIDEEITIDVDLEESDGCNVNDGDYNIVDKVFVGKKMYWSVDLPTNFPTGQYKVIYKLNPPMNASSTSNISIDDTRKFYIPYTYNTIGDKDISINLKKIVDKKTYIGSCSISTIAVPYTGIVIEE